MLHVLKAGLILAAANCTAARLVGDTGSHHDTSTLRHQPSGGGLLGLQAVWEFRDDARLLDTPRGSGFVAGSGSRELLQAPERASDAAVVQLPAPVLVGTPEEFIEAARNEAPYIMVTNHLDFTQLGGESDPLMVLGIGTEVVRVRSFFKFPSENVFATGQSVSGRCPCCLLYTSPSPRDRTRSRMPSSA